METHIIMGLRITLILITRGMWLFLLHQITNQLLSMVSPIMSIMGRITFIPSMVTKRWQRQWGFFNLL